MTKIHWDKARDLYNSAEKKYNSVEETAMDFEEPLRRFLKEKDYEDPFFIKNEISRYAYNSFLEHNYREAFFEIYIKLNDNKIKDKKLMKIMETIFG